MPGTSHSGRKSVPTTLKLLRGNPGRRALNDAEPTPPKPARLPPPPAELSDAAKREWRRTGKKLLAVGLLTNLDTQLFASYCESYSRWLSVIKTLGKTPVLIMGKNGDLIRNPLLRVEADLQVSFSKILLEFGCSPSSRSRVKATPAVVEEDSFETWRKS